VSEVIFSPALGDHPHGAQLLGRRPDAMTTYSKKDFEHIAAALGKDPRDVLQHAKRFEAAARWYRLDSNAKLVQRSTPSATRKRLQLIANAARKLLRHLKVFDPAEAPDGPSSDVLIALVSADDQTEDPVVRATARIGRLVEILEAGDAARELERRAHREAENAVQVGKLIGIKGHQGDAAVNDWIAAAISIYRQITGRNPSLSTVAANRLGRGKATGPLIRFLQAAGKPLGIQSSPDSLAARVKDIRAGGRRRQK
jgi:hypothetical protein